MISCSVRLFYWSFYLKNWSQSICIIWNFPISEYWENIFNPLWNYLHLKIKRWLYYPDELLVILNVQKSILGHTNLISCSMGIAAPFLKILFLFYFFSSFNNPNHFVLKAVKRSISLSDCCHCCLCRTRTRY